MLTLFILFFYFHYGCCYLWPKGVVHYSINTKDYDQHSVDEILSAISKVQQLTCVKFFKTPFVRKGPNASTDDKILYINNPQKQKDCPPGKYDFSNCIVDMTIGYKCINEKDIARVLADMLKSSIEQNSVVNSFDLLKKFQNSRKTDTSDLISEKDRNYINSNYQTECNALKSNFGQVLSARKAMDDPLKSMSAENIQFYNALKWPMAIVMWGVDRKIGCDESTEKERNLKIDQHLKQLRKEMGKIMLHSCVVFQEVSLEESELMPKNLIIFSTDEDADDDPQLGFMPGNQTLSLFKIAAETRQGHRANTINSLMRILGIPMMSNRFDRDNYVKIRWDNVEKGKEHLLERLPEAAWIKTMKYDFNSVTHAPPGYMRDPTKGTATQTVQPVMEWAWPYRLQMGHVPTLSDSDKRMLDVLYHRDCDRRLHDY